MSCGRAWDKAATKPPAGTLFSVFCYGTGSWQNHPNELSMLTHVQQAFRPLAERALATSSDTLMPGVQPLIDNDRGRLWVGVLVDNSIDVIIKRCHNLIVTIINDPARMPETEQSTNPNNLQGNPETWNTRNCLEVAR